MSRYLLFLMCTSVSYANEPLVFKPAFTPNYGWLAYSFALVLLLLIVFIISKKDRAGFNRKSILTLIEKKQISNKTVVYVIHYKQQHFLLADNQHALAIHPLIQEEPNEQV